LIFKGIGNIAGYFWTSSELASDSTKALYADISLGQAGVTGNTKIAWANIRPIREF
jgi:hypothetical protein